MTSLLQSFYSCALFVPRWNISATGLSPESCFQMEFPWWTVVKSFSRRYLQETMRDLKVFCRQKTLWPEMIWAEPWGPIAIHDASRSACAAWTVAAGGAVEWSMDTNTIENTSSKALEKTQFTDCPQPFNNFKTINRTKKIPKNIKQTRINDSQGVVFLAIHNNVGCSLYGHLRWHFLLPCLDGVWKSAQLILHYFCCKSASTQPIWPYIIIYIYIFIYYLAYIIYALYRYP